jgi:hypothetical protein
MPMPRLPEGEDRLGRDRAPTPNREFDQSTTSIAAAIQTSHELAMPLDASVY